MRRDGASTSRTTDYGGKPRPAVVLQNDEFAAIKSVTICAFTSSEADALPVRPVVLRAAANGLRSVSRLMIDKIGTVPRTRLGARIGRLADANIERLEQGILIFFGMAAKHRPRP